jgi:hypothetical protein
MTEREPDTGEIVVGHFVSVATFKTHERQDKQRKIQLKTDSSPSAEEAIAVQTLLHPGHGDAVVEIPYNDRKTCKLVTSKVVSTNENSSSV